MIPFFGENISMFNKMKRSNRIGELHILLENRSDDGRNLLIVCQIWAKVNDRGCNYWKFPEKARL
jgi:hypothetical protein